MPSLEAASPAPGSDTGTPHLWKPDLGYTPEDLAVIPCGALPGQGCGTPVHLAGLLPGEVVVDLGCGAGADVFLASRFVGTSGKVIGVDISPAQITQAQALRSPHPDQNIVFTLGDNACLPLEDNTADVILSNNAIGFSPDPGRVFREAFRVLRPGGHLILSERVQLPSPTQPEYGLGLMPKETFLQAIRAAEFAYVEVLRQSRWEEEPTGGVVASVQVQAFKPGEDPKGASYSDCGSAVLHPGPRICGPLPSMRRWAILGLFAAALAGTLWFLLKWTGRG